ncbi:MAG: hypothetical protein WCK43_08255, partial [bacterium]
MRILNWNCNNGISNKRQIDYLKSFNADVVIIPEIKKSNIKTLSPDSYVWATNNHLNLAPKGLGVLSFNGYTLEECPRDEDMELFIPVKVKSSKQSFNLVAVWNFYSACKQGRFKGVTGPECVEFSALKYYKDFLKDPCLIAGDWNLGPTFAQAGFLRIM